MIVRRERWLTRKRTIRHFKFLALPDHRGSKIKTDATVLLEATKMTRLKIDDESDGNRRY
jgi:hypothetical protein